MNSSAEYIKLQSEIERKKAKELLAKAKTLNRPVRVIPIGMTGEQLQKLRKR